MNFQVGVSKFQFKVQFLNFEVSDQSIEVKEHALTVLTIIQAKKILGENSDIGSTKLNILAQISRYGKTTFRGT